MEETITLTKKEIKVVEDTAKTLFDLLGVTVEISVENSDQGCSLVAQTEESGILIGYHGEVLESIQLVLSLMVSKKIGRFVRVSVEVGDYKKNRSEQLELLASQAKERALSENQEVSLTNLKSWERRVVHMMFQDDNEVVTESVGEGKERTLLIKPR